MQVEEASLVDYIEDGRATWRPRTGLVFAEALAFMALPRDEQDRLTLGRADRLSALREEIDRMLRREQLELFDP